MSRKRFARVGLAGSSVLRRSVIGGIVLALLLAVAGVTAYATRTEPAAQPSSSPATSPDGQPSPVPSPGKTTASAVDAPPRTTDPVVFARAATKALWSYDTRSRTQSEHLAGLKRWMTREKKYADWKSVTQQVPSPVLWSRMHDNGQRAKAKVNEGHFPQAFKRALSEDPGAIAQAYVYAVTVSGKQSIAWKGSGAGAEARSTTLAVQCRPGRSCALVGVLPSVAP
ncbi:hypothetical protein [Streptomyces sp. Da 82-17]|uniref:hypothetical protein n=1 Tax=Streptomyces sp. Da 82-17 TaxID=3377116 RepID=UPI0038D4A305